MPQFIPHPFTPQQKHVIERLKDREGWFWTFSLTPDGQEARTLHSSGGLSIHLPFAPETLPIYQIEDLPGL